MFIRAGGIIPQIPVRQYVSDIDRPGEIIPITIHIYPGRSNVCLLHLAITKNGPDQSIVIQYVSRRWR